MLEFAFISLIKADGYNKRIMQDQSAIRAMADERVSKQAGGRTGSRCHCTIDLAADARWFDSLFYEIDLCRFLEN